MKTLKKTVSTILIFSLCFLQSGAAVVRAQMEIPTPPPIPTAPPVPTVPPVIPTPEPIPTEPPAPTTAPVDIPVPTKTPKPTYSPSPESTVVPIPTSTPTPLVTPSGNETGPLTLGDGNTGAGSVIEEGTGGNASNGGNSGSSIETGDSTNQASMVTTGNTNSSISENGNQGSVSVGNDSNGAGSQNGSSIQVGQSTDTIQNNNAKVENNMSLVTETGQNSASKNTGGDNKIVTGDANTSGTVITAVNTNVDGVSVSEFNVADDHKGDIILDFGAQCVISCGSGANASVANSGNGSGSSNESIYDAQYQSNVFQNNTADVESNLTLVSDTGNNTASKNTGGNSEILTGDANVSANALTFVNNNLSGNIYYGVVNIYGNLEGDIILPEELVASLRANNSGNGAGSQNDSQVQTDNATNINQSNNANIQNNLILAADTGSNNTDKNTNGQNSINTGEANISANVLNIANTNLTGGTWWLVIVNEAGKWVGRIIGENASGNLAGSDGTVFTVNESGEVTAQNSGNGEGSQNSSQINQSSVSNLTQTNSANVVNNLNLAANTGGNNASKNTGGSSSIQTGDATIVANLVNFVNNNISGGGKLLVTVVNVFGSWFGNFITPGAQKDPSPTPIPSNPPSAVGGIASLPSSNSNSNSSSNTSSDSGNTNQPQGNARVAYASFPKAKHSVLALATESTENKPGEIADNSLALAGEPSSSKVNINLAWLLPIVAVGLLFALIRRFRATR